MLFPGLSSVLLDKQLLFWGRKKTTTYSMMGAERSLVTVFLSRMWANGFGLVGDGGGGEANAAVIYNRRDRGLM